MWSEAQLPLIPLLLRGMPNQHRKAALIPAVYKGKSGLHE